MWEQRSLDTRAGTAILRRIFAALHACMTTTTLRSLNILADLTEHAVVCFFLRAAGSYETSTPFRKSCPPLFHTLHSDEADKRDLSPLRRAALLLTLPIVMALAVPVSLLLRLLVRAGTLIVVAWKPVA